LEPFGGPQLLHDDAVPDPARRPPLLRARGGAGGGGALRLGRAQGEPAPLVNGETHARAEKNRGRQHDYSFTLVTPVRRTASGARPGA